MKYIFNLLDETFPLNPIPTPNFIIQPIIEETVWFACVQCDEILFRGDHVLCLIGEDYEHMVVNEVAVREYGAFDIWGYSTHIYRCPDCRTRISTSPLYALPFTNRCDFSTSTERRALELAHPHQLRIFRYRYAILKSKTVEPFVPIYY